LSSAGTFPVEVHGLTFEGLTESARDVEDFTGTGWGDVFVEEMTEVRPAAPRGVRTIDDAPPFLGVPFPHRSYRLHAFNPSWLHGAVAFVDKRGRYRSSQASDQVRSARPMGAMNNVRVGAYGAWTGGFETAPAALAHPASNRLPILWCAIL